MRGRMVCGGGFDMEGEEEQGTASMLTRGFLARVAGQMKVPLTTEGMHKGGVFKFEISEPSRR